MIMNCHWLMNVNHDYCHYYGTVYMKLACPLSDNEMSVCCCSVMCDTVTVFGPCWLSVPETEGCFMLPQVSHAAQFAEIIMSLGCC